MAPLKICVIGAGVNGLSCAFRLLEAFPGSEVVVMADKFSPNTTSDVSGGFWIPNLLGNTSVELIRKWSQETLNYMVRLADSEDAADVGAAFVSGYDMSSESKEEPQWKDMVFGYRHLEKREIERFPGMKWGIFYTTVMLDVRLYLPWLMKKFFKKGGRVIQRHITDIDELCTGQYDVIVNCTAVWSNQLVGDKEVTPVRGQVMRVKAPWIKQFFVVHNGDDIGYILPGSRYVVLGGTEQYGNWNRESDLNDKSHIHDMCCRFIPSLKGARVEIEEAGLRPFRSSVRLERTVHQVGDRKQHVIHNYGQGGSGVTLHWGCASHVTRLVAEIFGPRAQGSKL